MARVTSLSIGSLIREVLLENEDVAAITDNVFPVITNEAELPYVFYKVASLQHDATKGGNGHDTIQLEVNCCAETYLECVNLSEAVRSALDYIHADDENLHIESSHLTGYTQGWAEDAYVDTLNFTIKV